MQGKVVDVESKRLRSPKCCAEFVLVKNAQRPKLVRSDLDIDSRRLGLRIHLSQALLHLLDFTSSQSQLDSFALRTLSVAPESCYSTLWHHRKIRKGLLENSPHPKDAKKLIEEPITEYCQMAESESKSAIGMVILP